MILLKLTSRLCGFSKHLRLQPLQTVSRFRFCSQSTNNTSTSSPYLDEIDHEEYGKLRTIYKFSYMPKMGIVYNCKYTLLGGYILLFIGEVCAYLGELIDAIEVMNICIVKLVLYSQVLMLNKLVTKLIGFIYITEDDSLLISYTNFWGERVDEKFAKNELVLKCNESNKFLSRKNRLYVKLVCPITNRVFKINLKYSIMNEAKMMEYFGPLPRSAF